MRLLRKSGVFLVVMAGMALGLAGARPAEAQTAQLRLTQGLFTVTVTDVDADGVVTYMGPLGTYNVNVSTGVSRPAIGGPTSWEIDLSSVNNNNAVTSDPLTIEFTDTGFSHAGPFSVNSAVGGTLPNLAGATATFTSIVNYGAGGNNPFGVGGGSTASIGLGPFTPVAFSDSGSVSGIPAGTFSLTNRAVINLPRPGIASFDFHTTTSTVPEPASMALLGSGFLPIGLGFLRRRRKSQGQDKSGVV